MAKRRNLGEICPKCGAPKNVHLRPGVDACDQYDGVDGAIERERLAKQYESLSSVGRSMFDHIMRQ